MSRPPTVRRAVQRDVSGIHYCSTHSGTRNEDEDGCCDWNHWGSDNFGKGCVFHHLYIGAEVIDTTPDEDEEDDDLEDEEL